MDPRRSVWWYAGISVLLAVSTAPVRTEEFRPLSTAQVKHLKSESLAPILKVGDLPASVRTALQDLYGGPPLSLAEPDAPFAATDVITDQQLPGRRLIAAGCSPEHCLVHYERGGIAHVYYVVLFALSGTTSRLEWGGMASGRLPDIATVQSDLVAGRVKPGARDW
jgi:hypothetical protein